MDRTDSADNELSDDNVDLVQDMTWRNPLSTRPETEFELTVHIYCVRNVHQSLVALTYIAYIRTTWMTLFPVLCEEI